MKRRKLITAKGRNSAIKITVEFTTNGSTPRDEMILLFDEHIESAIRLAGNAVGCHTHKVRLTRA